MKHLDIHVHCDSCKKEEVEILAQNARQNSTVCCLSGGLRYGERDFETNETVLKICKEYPDCFLPLAKLDLWESADPAEVYHYAELGVKGFKCIYPYYEYDHDIYMPVYEAAEKCGLPLLFHTGNYRPSEGDLLYRRPMLKNMHPINLDRIARSFQNLKIVMAHLGTRIYQEEASQYVKMHKNLYADLGGCGQWQRLQADELTELFRSKMSEENDSAENFRKLVLGSDAYVTWPHLVGKAQGYYLRILERAGVPQDVIDDVMGRTVASWLGVELEK